LAGFLATLRTAFLAVLRAVFFAAGFFFAQIGAIGLLRRAIGRLPRSRVIGPVRAVRAPRGDACIARRERRRQSRLRAVRCTQTA
jgi:hypothetical protein